MRAMRSVGLVGPEPMLRNDEVLLWLTARSRHSRIRGACGCFVDRWRLGYERSCVVVVFIAGRNIKSRMFGDICELLCDILIGNSIFLTRLWLTVEWLALTDSEALFCSNWSSNPINASDWCGWSCSMDEQSLESMQQQAVDGARATAVLMSGAATRQRWSD